MPHGKKRVLMDGSGLLDRQRDRQRNYAMEGGGPPPGDFSAILGTPPVAEAAAPPPRFGAVPPAIMARAAVANAPPPLQPTDAGVSPRPAETLPPQLSPLAAGGMGTPPRTAGAMPPGGGLGAPPIEDFGREAGPGEGGGLGAPPPEFPTVTDDRRFNRFQLEGLRGIAEGLGNIDLKAPGDYMLGTANRRATPFIAEGIRSELAREEDFMSPQEIGLINQQFGLEIPEDSQLRRSQFRSVMPSLSSALRLNAQREKEAGINARHRERMEYGEEGRERVPDLDRRDLARSEKVLTGVRKIRDMYSNVEGELGPIWGRWNMVARKLGLANPEAVRTIADLSFQMSAFIYLMTGKQMNEQEMKRLENVLPQAWDSPGQFHAIVDGFLETVERSHEIELDNLERQGRDVSPWREPEGARVDNDMTPGPGGSRGKTQAFEVNGQVFDIPPEKIDEFLQDNPQARRAQQ